MYAQSTSCRIGNSQSLWRICVSVDLTNRYQVLDPDIKRIFIGTLKVWYIYNMMYLATLFYVKISILAFYRRLSPARGYQIALKLCCTAVALYTVGMILVNVSAKMLI